MAIFKKIAGFFCLAGGFFIVIVWVPSPATVQATSKSALQQLREVAASATASISRLAQEIESLPARRTPVGSYPCNGRLTTESGVPISTTDRSAQSVVYFTPYRGHLIALYDGTKWRMHSLTEISITLSGLTSDKNYDVFVYNNAGTLTLELAVWDTNTARLTALSTQDGVLVKNGDLTRRYIGTIRTTSTFTTVDRANRRYVWNHYNRANRSMSVTDTTDSWVYNSTTWRSANGGSATPGVEYVAGQADVLVYARSVLISTNGASPKLLASGIGIDSTSVNSAILFGSYGSGPIQLGLVADYYGTPGLGYHAIYWLESGDTGTTVTLYGDISAEGQSGMIASVEG